MSIAGALMGFLGKKGEEVREGAIGHVADQMGRAENLLNNLAGRPDPVAVANKQKELDEYVRASRAVQDFNNQVQR